jgi:hypothetical protein
MRKTFDEIKSVGPYLGHYNPYEKDFFVATLNLQEMELDIVTGKEVTVKLDKGIKYLVTKNLTCPIYVGVIRASIPINKIPKVELKKLFNTHWPKEKLSLYAPNQKGLRQEGLCCDNIWDIEGGLAEVSHVRDIDGEVYVAFSEWDGVDRPWYKLSALMENQKSLAEVYKGKMAKRN